MLAVLTTGCTREQWHRFPSPDDVVALVPWFAVMRTSPAIYPYKMPLQPPEGAVPVGGVERVPVATPGTRAALDALSNPVQRTADALERGRERYDVYCTVCHGETGAGDGPVAQSLANAVRNLTEPTQRERSDGWIYSVVKNGFGLMPEYGSKLTPEDRWNIVHYVRQLQGAAQ
jgi:mono/diheme cytochrome c family protein